jgi:hypothetical protein
LIIVVSRRGDATHRFAQSPQAAVVWAVGALAGWDALCQDIAQGTMGGAGLSFADDL